MNVPRAPRGLLAAIALLVLLGSNAGLAQARGASASQPISFTVDPTVTLPQCAATAGMMPPGAFPGGCVVNLGDQKYRVSGGQVQPGSMVDGQWLNPEAKFTFSMEASVKGLSASGDVKFDLKGTFAGTNQPVSVSGEFPIDSKMTFTMSQVVPGPSGVCTGKAAKSCSELPAFFVGSGNVKVKMGGESDPAKTTMMLENPYFNPFGAPILLSSADRSIEIVTMYDVGTIEWKGSQVLAPIAGTLGTSPPTPIAGTLSLNSTENEDLVTGMATDHGTIALDSMTPAFLTTQGDPGRYMGSSCIPGNPDTAATPCTPVPPGSGTDCSMNIGLPAGSGLCTATGFDSMGWFTVTGSSTDRQQVTIKGQYMTIWTAPALAFTSSAEGMVTTQSK